MTIFVVLPVHNRWNLTQQFLASLDAQTLPEETNLHLVAVDDGSTDATAQELAKRPGTTVLIGRGGLWWGGSVAKAIDWVRPRLREDDFVYLANNDTVLDPHHLSMLWQTHKRTGADLVGSISFEIWPGGERHPVTNAFHINRAELNVTNTPPEQLGSGAIDALAGRGLLVTSRAARLMHMNATLMPQHFADIAATARLIRQGMSVAVETQATSTQLERAGSSVEHKPSLMSLASKRSSIYAPALLAFWWQNLSPAQRLSLTWRMPARGLRQVFRGSYSLK